MPGDTGVSGTSGTSGKSGTSGQGGSTGLSGTSGASGINGKSLEPIQTITGPLQLVVAGITRLNSPSVITVSIDENIYVQTHMRIFNISAVEIDVNAPTGWSFSDGSTSIHLGFWASANLSYYGDQVIIIDSQSPGVQP
jgi:hypothetical protein